MEAAEKIIELLPDIILYLVSGFIFLEVFYFISSKQNSQDYTHIITKSLIYGYILTNICYLFSNQTGNYIIGICIFIGCCIVSSFVLAKIYTSHIFEKICCVLKIRRTINNYIWYDIWDSGYGVWVRAQNPDTYIEYYGRLEMFEEFQRKPMIVLSRYTKRNYKKDIVFLEYNADKTKRVLIDTSEYKIIELIYNENSRKINHHSRKCNKHKNT